ncbi:hypothetical protein BKA93DRAFT_745546 [Sparassis latifolia]
MPPRQSPPPEISRRGEQRPTLPPIRQLFGTELSQSVPPPQARQPTSSPHIPFHRLTLQDEERRYASSSPSAGQRSSSLILSHSHPSHHGHPGSSSSGGHLSNPSDPLYRSQAYDAPQQYPPHGLVHPSAYPPQALDRSAMASGTYPYSTSLPAMQQQSIPLPGPSAASLGDFSAERLSKYECGYCGKGFTRPSSLKEILIFPDPPQHSYRRETRVSRRIKLQSRWLTLLAFPAFMCPYPGCGRSFSVQSNMRRHARVHSRTDTPQQEQGEESMEESDEQTSSDREETPPADSSKGKDRA